MLECLTAHQEIIPIPLISSNFGIVTFDVVSHTYCVNFASLASGLSEAFVRIRELCFIEVLICNGLKAPYSK